MLASITSLSSSQLHKKLFLRDHSITTLTARFFVSLGARVHPPSRPLLSLESWCGYVCRRRRRVLPVCHGFRRVAHGAEVALANAVESPKDDVTNVLLTWFLVCHIKRREARIRRVRRCRQLLDMNQTGHRLYEVGEHDGGDKSATISSVALHPTTIMLSAMYSHPPTLLIAKAEW